MTCETHVGVLLVNAVLVGLIVLFVSWLSVWYVHQQSCNRCNSRGAARHAQRAVVSLPVVAVAVLSRPTPPSATVGTCVT